MGRFLAMIAGVAGAIGLSQFPEFSQQYVQRLSGAVDELRVVVISFDAGAAAAGLTREEALKELSGTPLQDSLRDTIGDSVTRYERLNADLTALGGKDALSRLAQVWRFADRNLAERTWAAFRPAVPVTWDGALCAGIGFAGGWLALSLILGLILRPFRRWGLA